jgi:hypothetical protein
MNQKQLLNNISKNNKNWMRKDLVEPIAGMLQECE